MKRLTLIIFCGILTFSVALYWGYQIIDPIVCDDGWRSASIGKQGACSHHASVDSTPATTVDIVSVLIGGITMMFVHHIVTSGGKNKIFEPPSKQHYQSLREIRREEKKNTGKKDTTKSTA